MKYTKTIRKWTAGILASTMLALTVIPHMDTEIVAMASSEPEYGTMTGYRTNRRGIVHYFEKSKKSVDE